MKQCRCDQCRNWRLSGIHPTFRCSACKRTVGWCRGGGSSDADPKGTKCDRCWLRAAKRLDRKRAA